MKIIINLDNKRNDISFTLFVFISFISFFYFSSTIQTNSLYVLNFLLMGVLFTAIVSEDRSSTNKGRNISRCISLIFLLILIFFQGSFNKFMFIYFVIAGAYYALRGFSVLKFSRFNYETEEYYYL